MVCAGILSNGYGSNPRVLNCDYSKNKKDKRCGFAGLLYRVFVSDETAL